MPLPAEAALFDAIDRADEAGIRAALRAGADPNLSRRPGTGFSSRRAPAVRLLEVGDHPQLLRWLIDSNPSLGVIHEAWGEALSRRRTKSIVLLLDRFPVLLRAGNECERSKRYVGCHPWKSACSRGHHEWVVDRLLRPRPETGVLPESVTKELIGWSTNGGQLAFLTALAAHTGVPPSHADSVAEQAAFCAVKQAQAHVGSGGSRGMRRTLDGVVKWAVGAGAALNHAVAEPSGKTMDSRDQAAWTTLDFLARLPASRNGALALWCQRYGLTVPLLVLEKAWCSAVEGMSLSSMNLLGSLLSVRTQHSPMDSHRVWLSAARGAAAVATKGADASAIQAVLRRVAVLVPFPVGARTPNPMRELWAHAAKSAGKFDAPQRGTERWAQVLRRLVAASSFLERAGADMWAPDPDGISAAHMARTWIPDEVAAWEERRLNRALRVGSERLPGRSKRL